MGGLYVRGFLRAEQGQVDIFATSLPTNTTTGVLREHLMRLSSSVKCENIDRSAFPEQCPGDQPLSASFRRGNGTNIRLCVPGHYGRFPWTLSRNRQDHGEEVFLDMWDGAGGERAFLNSFHNISATIHCTANTTRGYFELRNLRNNDTYGPLLDRWPERDEMLRDYNDWTDDGKNGYVPSETDTFEGKDPPHELADIPSESWKVPGLLTLSTLALFGNRSWFNSASEYTINMTYEADNDGILPWRLMCAGLPFSNFWLKSEFYFPSNFIINCKISDLSISAGFATQDSDLLLLMHNWLSAFAPYGNDKSLVNIEGLLDASMFLANRALLTFYSPEKDASSLAAYNNNGRTIFTSPGLQVQKPVISTTALVVLSVLLGLQLLGLGYLVYYLYHVPTWTAQLEAMAMARIGASLEQRGVLPPLGPVDKEDVDALHSVDGLIGVVGKEQGYAEVQSGLVPRGLLSADGSEVELRQPSPDKDVRVRAEEFGPEVRLGLGASGVIRSGSMATRLPS